MIKQLTKAQALRAYQSGLTVKIIPSKCNPLSIWWESMRFNEAINKVDFNKLISNIKFYNCNKETGRTLKYYIEEESEAIR